MNSIAEVEYLKDGVLIVTSNQFEMQNVITTDDSARFTLAYSSLLLQSHFVDKIGMFAEKEKGK